LETNLLQKHGPGRTAARHPVTRSPATPGVFSVSAWSVLTAAVDRAAESLARTEHAPVEEVRRGLRHVLELLTRARAESTEFTLAFGAGVPRSHVDALRCEFLTGLEQPVGDENGAGSGRSRIATSELVGILTAMERISGRFGFGRRSDFVERLASPRALEAVIEVAHDMRSPLASILFLVDAIQRGQSGPVTPVQERQLGLIYGAALGLNSMASDVIDAVRGHRLVDGLPVPFSVSETISNVCAVVRPIGEEKDLPILVTFPAADSRVGYPAAVNRVLVNLTTNALRYTEKGSVSVGCTELPDDVVEFWVVDTGRGIPDNVLAMLYDGFRPGSVGLRFSSAGLGLAICRSLLESMGSTLQVQTAMEKGTRFSFKVKLPLA
jgi:signal transduction histidine kinase